jgi:hypothetical protein
MRRALALAPRLGAVAVLLCLLAQSARAAGASNDADDWQSILFFGGFAAVSFWQMWRNLRRARAIEDTPTARVASAPQGGVELSGRAVPIEGKIAVCPLTGASCLWYFFKIERYERRGKSSGWVTVSSGRSSDIFGLEDRTGTALVAPFGADVTPFHRRQWRGSSPTPSSGFESGGLFSGFGSYRYTEELILPDDFVYVLGWFETIHGASSSIPDLREKLRALKENPREMLARFDTDKDGEISVEEWDAARAIVAEEIQRVAMNLPPMPDVHTVVSPQDSDLPFLISTISQEQLAAKYKRRAALGLAGFLGFGSAAVWALSQAMKGL